MSKSGTLIYEGKAKSLFQTDNSDELLVEFRDDTSAFDGQRIEQLSNKGKMNNCFNAFIMTTLQNAGIPTHFIAQIDETHSRVKHLDMIPIECVIRNRAAGGLCKRLGIKRGIELTPPLLEFFLKNDALHDPMVAENHILQFGWASKDDLDQMTKLTNQTNDLLKPLFHKAGMILVDFKLEFGRSKGHILLGDEFSPDGCRIWDIETGESLDKDRFRQSQGMVVESYQTVADRLGIKIPIN